jgi:hypothetical protein
MPHQHAANQGMRLKRRQMPARRIQAAPLRRKQGMRLKRRQMPARRIQAEPARRSASFARITSVYSAPQCGKNDTKPPNNACSPTLLAQPQPGRDFLTPFRAASSCVHNGCQQRG